MSTSSSSPESLFELGKLHSERGDFFQGMDLLRLAADEFMKVRNFHGFLKCQNILLRLYAETEQENQIFATKEKLQDLVLKEGFELSSKTYYTLALCASYKGQLDTALEYCQKALAIALANDNKEDICYAISGTAIVYWMMKRYDDALKEIYNLQIFFEVMPLPEIKSSTLVLNAIIHTELKKYDHAIEILWQAYDLVKAHKTMMTHIYLLFHMGRTYLKAGQRDLARLYLNLAAKSVDSKNMVRLAKQIDLEMKELGHDGQSKFDLVFDVENHTVKEQRLGAVDFKNQFILLDLLKLFALNQGQVYSKEFLVEHVWKQDYDPAVHDNKIYVTIKRLRKMIEPDFEKPRYIFRAKNGYFMNKSANIMIENATGGLS